jgi:hypothetical protein
MFRECQDYGYDPFVFCYEILGSKLLKDIFSGNPRPRHCSVEGLFELLECDSPDFVRKYRTGVDKKIDGRPLEWIAVLVFTLFEQHGLWPHEIYEKFEKSFIEQLYSAYGEFKALDPRSMAQSLYQMYFSQRQSQR